MDLNADFQSEVTRYDEPNVIAMDRQKALKLGIRLTYDSGGYKAGTVLARNTVTGLYAKYSDAASSGLNDAVAVLERGVAATEFANTTTHSVANSVLTYGIFGGVVFYDKLTGIDANGVTDLRGKVMIGADGVNLLRFG